MIYSPTDPRLALDHHSLESLCSTCGECGALTDTPEERAGVDLCEECAEDYDEDFAAADINPAELAAGPEPEPEGE